jgi:hypothetical protein
VPGERANVGLEIFAIIPRTQIAAVESRQASALLRNSAGRISVVWSGIADTIQQLPMMASRATPAKFCALLWIGARLLRDVQTGAAPDWMRATLRHGRTFAAP